MPELCPSPSTNTYNQKISFHFLNHLNQSFLLFAI